MGLFYGSDHREMRTRPITFRIADSVAFFMAVLCALSMVLPCASSEAVAEENDVLLPIPLVRAEETNSQEVLQAILQIQGQLRSNQLAIEQEAKEAKEAVAQNAEALSNGLKRIETEFSIQVEAFSARSARELEAMQRSNRSALIVTATVGSLAFLTMLITAYFQWSASRVWAEIATASSNSRRQRESHVDSLGISSQPADLSRPVEDVNLRFLGALEQLEKRIHHLEQNPPALGIQDPALLSAEAQDDAHIAELLRHGLLRLKENQLETALKCFEQVLSINPNHPEALVRKGTILEQLKKPSEALECYDLAIAADGSMTSAYLHKGRLYNRLERFKEALECYEKALQAQPE